MKKASTFISGLILSLMFASQAQAMCPVCTVAVAGGIGFARWLKIDDTISGLWIGGLLASVSMWTINWLNGRKIKFIGRQPLVWIFWYAITLIPLAYWPIQGITVIGHPANTLWGWDKVLLGTAIGTVLFAAGGLTYQYLKAKNNDHAHFPFEKIVLAVGPLIISSYVFYLITKI